MLSEHPASASPQSSLETRLAAEREHAARALLMSPLLSAEADRESFTLVRRHCAG